MRSEDSLNVFNTKRIISADMIWGNYSYGNIGRIEWFLQIGEILIRSGWLTIYWGVYYSVEYVN